MAEERSAKTIPVAFVIPGLRIGGAERQLLYLVRNLDRRKFAPLVITLNNGQTLEPEMSQAGVEVLKVARRHRWDFSPLWGLARLFRQRAIQAVVTMLPPAPLFGLAAARLAGVPVRIGTERGTAYAVSRFSHRAYLQLENRLLRGASLVVANSRAGRNFLLSRGVAPDRALVIYNGLGALTPPGLTRQEMRLRLGIGPEQPIIGTVASFTAKKDHSSLLGAAAQVIRRFPAARFILVGEGPLRPALERQITQLGINDQVLLVGEQNQVSDWLELFDVAVLPSVDREGCSNFLMEAQYFGKPVIATRIGGNPEVLAEGRSGLLTPPSDPDRLAEAILQLLQDPPYAGRLGQYGKHWVASKFALQTYVAAWEENLSRLAERKVTQASRA